MPAKSAKQQRFFGMVHAYQAGKLPADRVSARVKHVAKTISPDDAKKYAETPHAGLDELKKIYESVEYVEVCLGEIVQSGTPNSVHGSMIDKYTAALMLAVSKNLNEHNKKEFFRRPITEAVTIAYKLITH